MEGEERDPGYDDWFDEPEPPSETQNSARRDVYDGDDEVWVLPEEEDATRSRGGPGGIVIGGRTLTTTQVVIIAVSILVVIFALLAAFGAFSSSPPVPTVSTPPPPPTTTQATTTQTTTQTTQVPSQTLMPGDTGLQVKELQVALNSLGYSVGTPDGDYGPATQSAVEQFQAANNLATDGVVGPETLAKLQQSLSG
jgi:hypothetical protein